MERRNRLAGTILPACLVVTLLLTSATASGPTRVIAVADVHGAYAEFVALLQRVGLIDGNLLWSGGSATLVQTGDVLDRGRRSRECLDLLMALEPQAAKKGGNVIPLLGNHEFMNVIGDLRYVTPEIFLTFATPDSEKNREEAYKDYLEFLSAHGSHSHTVIPPTDDAGRRTWMDEHPPGFVEYRDAFGPKGKYGQWIRTHHAVVQIGDGVFAHGGLNPTLEFGSVRELDDRVMAELPAFDSMWRALVDAKVIWRHMMFAEAVRFAGEELKWLQAAGNADVPGADLPMTRLLGYKNWMAVSAQGPLWYRGLAQEPEEKLIGGVKAMLERLQAQYIVVGHTVESKADITPRFENRVFLLDTGMLKEEYGGRATALEIQNGRFTAHYAEGEPKALPAPASGKNVPPRLQQSVR
jgi:hypothetical protein